MTQYENFIRWNIFKILVNEGRMDSHKLRILIIENDNRFAKLIKTAFSDYNQDYELVQVTTISKVDTILCKNDIRAIITNFEVNDKKATALFINLVNQYNIPTIALIANNKGRQGMQAIRCGAVDYVIKTDEHIKQIPQVVEKTLCLWQHFSDKTDQRTSKESEERFRELAELLPAMVVETDTEGNVTYANQNGFKLSGYSITDVHKGLNVTDLFVPEELPKVMENMQSLLSGTEMKPDEYLAKRKDGSPFPVHICSSTISKNNSLSGIRSVLFDMSEIKTTQKQLNNSLKSSADIVQAIPSGLVIFQYEPPDKLLIISGNPKAEQITGYNFDELKGKNFTEICPEAARTGILKSFLEVIQTGNNHEHEYSYKDDNIEGIFKITTVRSLVKQI